MDPEPSGQSLVVITSFPWELCCCFSLGEEGPALPWDWDSHLLAPKAAGERKEDKSHKGASLRVGSKRS